MSAAAVTGHATTTTDAAAFLLAIHAEGDVREIRSPNAPSVKGKSYRRTWSGYFDSPADGARMASRLDIQTEPTGTYVTINPCKLPLLARRANKMEFEVQQTTTDAEIDRLRWIPVDIDSVRPSGISATDGEVAAAGEVAERIISELAAQGWAEPIRVMTGNGWQLHIPIDLEPTPPNADLVRRVLQGLAERFDTETAKVDLTTGNPSRIVKVPGTWARKGDSMPDRPHRQCYAIIPPDPRGQVVSREQLEQVAKPKPEPRPARQVPATTSRRRHTDEGMTPSERCRRFLGQRIGEAISGSGGHRTTFAAAAACWRYGLSDAEAWEVMQWFNATMTGGEPWTEKELQHKLDSARQTVEQAGEFGVALQAGGEWRGHAKRPQSKPKQSQPQAEPNNPTHTGDLIQGISNAFENWEDCDDDGKPKIEPKTMAQFLRETHEQTQGFPKKANGCLFVVGKDKSIQWLEKTPSVFGYLQTVKPYPIYWKSGAQYMTKPEAHAELLRQAEEFVAIEDYPHEPPMPRTFYRPTEIKPNSGERMRELLAFFEPETPIDGDLMLAYLLTLFWGGGGGERPCFIVTASGRGCGKSTVIEQIASLAGGAMHFSTRDEAKAIKERLLSSEGLRRRVALLDNVKTQRFSWADLEGLITAKEISGKRMYIGEASCPNTITWAVTLNGVSLSKDMAQRSVIIRVKRPEQSGLWKQRIEQFITEHANEIIGGALGMLRDGERADLAKYTRWGRWEQDILRLLPEPNEAQQVLEERRLAVDADQDDAQELQRYIEEQIEKLNYRADEVVHIPSRVLADWISEATGERVKPTAAARTVNQLIEEQTLSRITPNKSRTYGRGFLFWGFDSDASTSVSYDLEPRIEVRRQRST